MSFCELAVVTATRQEPAVGDILTGLTIILLNIMSLDIDIIYTNDIFRLQSSDMTFGALLYLA